MKKLKLKQILYGMLVLTIALSSCKKSKDTGDSTPVISQKVYVINEGNYGSGNASVSIYDASNNKVYNDLFNSANNRPIGDVLQSLTLVNGKAYFVVNNSNKIEITNAYPLTSVGVINGFKYPRYMVVANNNKAYVSEYINFSGITNGRLSIIDLSTNTVTGNIDVGIEPENMLLVNGKLYVCNSGDTLLSVINTTTDVVESKIKISDGPTALVLDANQKLWVLCEGITKYNGDGSIASQTAGALVRIDPTSNNIEAKYTFSNADASGVPPSLAINGLKNQLYYGYAGVIYSQSISATSLPTMPIITRSFYGMGVDPTTGYVYIGTYGFSSNQKMIRYQSNGTPIDSIEVGVGPSRFVFAY
ncbi:MAG TPA: DUF5074 domain-containing protein [Cytophagaceae bacterium]|jgi:YVTN family beta-propeller protein|nr:DUF5074 domain-containing protein [Cytophagaceae bacterium]